MDLLPNPSTSTTSLSAGQKKSASIKTFEPALAGERSRPRSIPRRSKYRSVSA